MDGAPERLWRFGERQLQNRLVGLCAFSPIAMEPRWMGTRAFVAVRAFGWATFSRGCKPV